MIEFNTAIIETEEYKELFEQTKMKYPGEYDYFLHIACIAHLKEKQAQITEEQDIIKSDVNIEIQDEIQEEHTSK